MKSDWYKTKKAGTYVVVPTGIGLSIALVPSEIQTWFSEGSAVLLKADVDSHEMAFSFGFLGVRIA